MKTNHTHGEANKAKLTRNAFFICLILSLTINIFQQINFYSSIGKDRTIISPQFITDNCEAWVNSFAASKCYLEAIAYGDAITLFTVNPKNGKLVQDKMLSRTHSSFYSEMKRFIFEQVKEIREKSYSFSFYITDVLADEKTQTVYVSGTINPKVGETDLEPEDVTWAFRYEIILGKALIKGFSEYKKK